MAQRFLFANPFLPKTKPEAPTFSRLPGNLPRPANLILRDEPRPVVSNAIGSDPLDSERNRLSPAEFNH